MEAKRLRQLRRKELIILNMFSIFVILLSTTLPMISIKYFQVGFGTFIMLDSLLKLLPYPYASLGIFFCFFPSQRELHDYELNRFGLEWRRISKNGLIMSCLTGALLIGVGLMQKPSAQNFGEFEMPWGFFILLLFITLPMLNWFSIRHTKKIDQFTREEGLAYLQRQNQPLWKTILLGLLLALFGFWAILFYILHTL
ncbi:hypothetical protein DFP93_10629 [Aneurinibacillus soli]|uniref:Uncharacterized protein n=1 Tax=Aneurinibacillus soli TaxID=1500254 RepID=A0A0U5B109_9BACL|nr:hypothetical protein [Aneurinibacillus soli]PYE61837.1 hypothetical protein DFP93_10629 [Aneurinibacillus soli]BAU29653.1 hypothetical protein CB4_03890 [Aneurinibacillus soli]